MKNILKILKEEIKRVYSSKTLDALLPPLIFVVVQNNTSLKLGLISAISLALFLAFYRLIKGQVFAYAFGGVLAVGLAGAYAFYMGSAKSYFLPKLFTSALGAILAFGSLFLKRPLAAYLSHLSRGWPLDWYSRKDIRPAYREVTFAWAILFALRLLVLANIYQKSNLSTLAWVNLLLGSPSTILVLLLTYLYGIFRLKNLRGPGVEEFINKKPPPWEGQKRGF